eukprot:10642883-Alexandrium_andersonii.AAC.1
MISSRTRPCTLAHSSPSASARQGPDLEATSFRCAPARATVQAAKHDLVVDEHEIAPNLLIEGVG